MKNTKLKILELFNIRSSLSPKIKIEKINTITPKKKQIIIVYIVLLYAISEFVSNLDPFMK
jgi:hypothetical protein